MVGRASIQKWEMEYYQRLLFEKELRERNSKSEGEKKEVGLQYW